jgi:hypothetical protein
MTSVEIIVLIAFMLAASIFVLDKFIIPSLYLSPPSPPPIYRYLPVVFISPFCLCFPFSENILPFCFILFLYSSSLFSFFFLMSCLFCYVSLKWTLQYISLFPGAGSVVSGFQNINCLYLDRHCRHIQALLQFIAFTMDTLKFFPLQSSLNPGFWTVLAKTKLEVCMCLRMFL